MAELSTIFNVLLVLLGFGALIFVHELGHFLTAKWAGVRVHDFAIGFGPAVFSWRRGMGLRRGSTQREYAQLLRAKGLKPETGTIEGVGETEYRFNWIFLGGYVRMLGQDDADPGATSASPDSFTAKPVWKRMVIISAGVVMNIIVAALLFVAVFMQGLRQPAPMIGFVAPGYPAAVAQPVGRAQQAGVEPGLRAGDEVLAINGKPQHSFNYIQIATATARRGDTLRFRVQREGHAEALEFDISPERRDGMPGMQIGAAPGVSGQIAEFIPSDRQQAMETLRELGLGDVRPGMRLVAINGAPAATFRDIDSAVEAGDGSPVTLTFASPDGARAEGVITPLPRFQRRTVRPGEQQEINVQHLLGLTPPVVVADPGASDVILPGDVVARVAQVEWPDFATLVRELQAHKGRSVDLIVLRQGAYIPLQPEVNKQGRLGVALRGIAESPSIAARQSHRDEAASAPHLLPGTRITAVAGVDVDTFADVRSALRDATGDALTQGGGLSVELRTILPIGPTADEGPEETVAWAIDADGVAELHALGWMNPLPIELFLPELVTLKSASPVGALAMGFAETKRIVTLTYLTLLRFVQGSVRIEQFSGPVGIAHVGSRIARDGFIQLLFFLAVISANLAVLNFLPLPIVDGGHMVYLFIEGITGKPVSVAVQNIAALLGLCVIVGFFLIVTFNDIRNLFGA